MHPDKCWQLKQKSDVLERKNPGVSTLNCALSGGEGLGVCLGIMPRFVGHFVTFPYAAMKRPSSQLVRCQSNPPLLPPSLGSSCRSPLLLRWVVLLCSPLARCPCRVIFHVEHIRFWWTSSRLRNLLFLWTGCGERFPVASKVLVVHSEFCFGPRVRAQEGTPQTGLGMSLCWWYQVNLDFAMEHQGTSQWPLCGYDYKSEVTIRKEIIYFHAVRKARKAWKPFAIFLYKNL